MTERQGEYHPTNIYNLMTKTDKEFENTIAGRTDHEEDLTKTELNDVDLEVPSNDSRPLMKRMFSPMEAGSLRGSIFAMSSLALGTGCLALPKRFGQMSFVGAMSVIIIGSMAAYWSLTIMIQSALKAGTYDYSRLVKETLGKGLAKFLDIIILIYIFGILISYQVISKIFILF